MMDIDWAEQVAQRTSYRDVVEKRLGESEREKKRKKRKKSSSHEESGDHDTRAPFASFAVNGGHVERVLRQPLL